MLLVVVPVGPFPSQRGEAGTGVKDHQIADPVAGCDGELGFEPLQHDVDGVAVHVLKMERVVAEHERKNHPHPSFSRQFPHGRRAHGISCVHHGGAGVESASHHRRVPGVDRYGHSQLRKGGNQSGQTTPLLLEADLRGNVRGSLPSEVDGLSAISQQTGCPGHCVLGVGDYRIGVERVRGGVTNAEDFHVPEGSVEPSMTGCSRPVGSKAAR